MLKEKPIFITDLDDVLCKDGYIYLLNRFLHTSYTEEDFSDCYYIDSIIKDENLHNDLLKYWISANVYKHTNLINGAYDNLKELSEYVNVYICTACYFPEIHKKYSGYIYQQKYDYITDNLDFIKPENIIFANNKNIFSVAMFQVDDRTENLENNTKHRILFPAYHNLHISKADANEKGLILLENWDEIKKYVMEHI